MKVGADTALSFNQQAAGMDELEKIFGKDKAQGNTASIKGYAQRGAGMNFMGALFEMAQKYDLMPEPVTGNER